MKRKTRKLTAFYVVDLRSWRWQHPTGHGFLGNVQATSEKVAMARMAKAIGFPGGVPAWMAAVEKSVADKKNPPRKNPATLAIIGANPKRKRGRRTMRARKNPSGVRAVATIGRVLEVRYRRTVEPGKGQLYKHEYSTPMHLTALSDGSIHIWHPRVPAWEKE